MLWLIWVIAFISILYALAANDVPCPNHLGVGRVVARHLARTPRRRVTILSHLDGERAELCGHAHREQPQPEPQS